MIKRLLIIPAAVIMILSFTSCSKYPKGEKQPAKWNSSQSVKKEESLNTKFQDTIKDNQAKDSDSSSYNNGRANSAAEIDDLIKTIQDTGGAVDSLEDASDVDLKVPNPR